MSDKTTISDKDDISPEKITRQALPDKEYLVLLGIALCVFNSNNSFMIESILRLDEEEKAIWHNLIDKESGKLLKDVHNTVVGKHEIGEQAETLFKELINMRNRIIHSFQITYKGKQILATKDNETQEQFHITKEYLVQFIQMNERMNLLLYKIRGF